MGKKVKVGKARKDKFYELAKTEGFRSRAAYKLLQLDGKFNFLNRATVCIDLCAAPGGWLQAAKKRMPVSSIIVGVDLVPIRPIPNVITLVEDITTDKCKQAIKRVVHDGKASIVLHDGAPNVGKNWLHDAFMQAQLTLSALKLASAFLVSGGHFITKVFRSKDYNALLWVFGQMFKKVHSTKPQASRTESAEIFVFCQGYLAPDHIDPKFFDAKFVFKDVDLEPKRPLNLVHPEKQSKKAIGYAEGDFLQEHKLSALKFITEEQCHELLKNCTQIDLDDDRIANHKLTTNEIRECCKDIRVLGKPDLKALLKWQKAMRKFWAEINPSEVTVDPTEDVSEEEDEDKKELDAVNEEISKQRETKEKDLKRKKKLASKEKRKLREKLKLNMVIPGDRIEALDDIELFNINSLKSKQNQLADVSDQEEVPSDSDDEGYMDSEGSEMQFEEHLEVDEEKEEEDGKNEDDKDSDDSDDSDNESDDEGALTGKRKLTDKDSSELSKKRVKLNPYELAIGEEIIRSEKRKRELVELSYNRYVSNDDGLPEWFMKEEKLHCRKQTPVTKEQIEMYKERQKAIDVQPIKKVAEARARKKHKLVKRLEKARKKAEASTDNIEMSEREKMKQAKEIYKKAGLLTPQKRSLTYVVAKKHTTTGRRASRPDGVKGHYRVVDPRMKKDKKKQKMAMKKGKNGKKGSKRPTGKGRKAK